MKRALKYGAIGLVLAVLAFGAWRGFGLFRNHRQLTTARGMMQTGDYANASIALRRVLARNPRDIEAVRMMADLTETVASRAAIGWRREMVRLEPGVDVNQLAFARVALRFGDRESAEVALEGVSEAGKGTAAYHEMAVKLAEQSRHSAEARAHLKEAARLDPENAVYQFNLTLLDLRSNIPATQKRARSKMEELAKSPQTEGMATRALIEDALRRGDGTEALTLAERMSRAPEATFTDRSVLLNVLRRLKRKEFWWCLAQLEKQAEGEYARARIQNSAHGGVAPAVDLLLWLNRSGLASEAIEWTNRMPADMQVLEPVRIVMAETHQILGDWQMVGILTQTGNWGALDWKRKALYARALLAEGDLNRWRALWSEAVGAVRERPEALAELARMAAAWKWDEQVVEVLWLLAVDHTYGKSALSDLNRRYSAAGRTRDMLRVAQAALDADPGDILKKNNVAYLSMLLETNVDKAFAMAAEVYRRSPENPQFASTYAFSLYHQRNLNEALRVLRLLRAEQLEDPSVALCYGILLTERGSKEDADHYLELARGGSLLPEEKALIAAVQ